MKPIYDHFLVIANQECLDKEAAREESEKERVKEAQRNSKRIITSTNEKNIETDENKLLVEHKMDFTVLRVYSVNDGCEYVKPGDRVIVRANTMPEKSKLPGNLISFSYPEKSVSVMVEEGDIVDKFMKENNIEAFGLNPE